MTETNSTASSIWKSALGQIQLCVNKQSFETWFKDTEGISCDGTVFTVAADNSFIQENLQKSQTAISQEILSQVIGSPVTVKFTLKKILEDTPPTQSNHTKENRATDTKPSFNPATKEFTFERFIVGEHNRLAVSTALSIARHPGQSYNPLVIYGNVGLGKTHLLWAIGHLAAGEGHNAIFVSSEQFTNEFVTALREKKTDDFNKKYRSADILLIDDIQFIGGKTQTEECFFHTFNELRNSGKQMVITSNCHPRDIPEVDARLRSRFEWGMSIEILPPDEKNRKAIIRSLLMDNNLEAGDDFINYIASLRSDSVREIIGNFNKITAYARFTRKPLTIDTAEKALGKKGPDVKKGVLTAGKVLDKVGEALNINVEDIIGGKRDKATSFARRCVVFFLKERLNMSLSEIGRTLGGNSPSSVSQNYEKILKEIDEDIYAKRKIAEIENLISLS